MGKLDKKKIIKRQAREHNGMPKPTRKHKSKKDYKRENIKYDESETAHEE